MSGNQTFACPKCRKRFTWKPQYQGRKVSCNCGRTFEASLGLEGLVPQGDAYDVHAPESAAPPAPATIRSASPNSSITSLYPQRNRAAPAPVSEQENLDPEAANPLLHIYVPWALLVIGIGGWLGQTAHLAEGRSMTAALLRVIIEVHLHAGVMLGGAYIAAMVMGVNFGTLWRAAVKLAGIAVFSGAIAALAASLDKSPDGIRGMVLGMHAALLLYFALFYALFDLDLQESLTTVIIVWAMQWALAIAIVTTVPRG